MALNSGFHIFSEVWIDGSRRICGKEGDALGDSTMHRLSGMKHGHGCNSSSSAYAVTCFPCVLMRLALRGRMLEVVFLWPEFPTQFQADWWKTSRESCSVR